MPYSYNIVFIIIIIIINNIIVYIVHFNVKANVGELFCIWFQPKQKSSNV